MPGVVADDFVGMLMFDLPNPFSWYQVEPGLLAACSPWGFVDQQLNWHDQLLAPESAVCRGRDGHARGCAPRVRHYTLSPRRPL